jgi:hypothetical protein
MTAPQQFAIIDLMSQAAAVARHVRGWSREQILVWLNEHGTVRPISGGAYMFVSTTNREAIFLLDGDRLTFIVDNTTVVPE